MSSYVIHLDQLESFYDEPGERGWILRPGGAVHGDDSDGYAPHLHQRRGGGGVAGVLLPLADLLAGYVETEPKALV